MHPIPIVRIITLNEMREVLLLKRDNSRYGQGLWCLPGGKVDYGQTLEEACRHEMKQETNLDIKRLSYLFYQESLPSTHNEHHFLHHYFYATAVGDLKTNSESSKAEYVPYSKVTEYAIAFKNDVGLRRFFLETNGGLYLPK